MAARRRFDFGLAHGLGFATGLLSIGLPTGQLATGIISFNVGVEWGHMTIILAAYCLLGWWRKHEWYRPRVAIPLSAVMSAIALYWFMQRVAPGLGLVAPGR